VYAFVENRGETVRCLLDHPTAAATVNHRDEEGRTALWCAASSGRVAVVRALLEKGADPATADNQGRTPVAVSKLSKGAKGRACVDALKVGCSTLCLAPLTC
jgi:ankyrin repeat protein